MLTSVGGAGIAYACGAQIIVIIGIFIIGAAIPPFMVKRMKAKTMANFDKQLIDAMAILGNCVRAGFTFQQGLESIAKEMPDPIAREFGRTLRELNLGMPMEESLNRLVKRTGNEDLDLLVSAIIIQRQVGGNLSEILDNICITIKERLKIKNEIKVLTATGRVSGYVVGLLPIFLMVILMVINPGYMKMFFTTPIGRLMLIVAFILEGIGFLLVKKVVDIKF
jgi:tight adherence protein B